MDDEPQSNLLSGPIGPALSGLIGPMFVGLLLSASVGLADALTISVLGTNALAAFGLCFPFIALIQSLLFGFGGGITAAVAHVHGQSGHRVPGADVRRLVGVGVSTSVSLCAVLSGLGAVLGLPAMRMAGDDAAIVQLAWDYLAPSLLALLLLSVPAAICAALRGLGETRSSAQVMAVLAVVNGVLDPVFVWGLFGVSPMGIAGAAWATLAGTVLAGAYAVALLSRRCKSSAGEGDGGMTKRAAFDAIVSIGVPSMIGQALAPLGTALTVAMVAAQGAASLAAIGILQRIEVAVIMLPAAVSASLVAFVGLNWGAGRKERAGLAVQWSRRRLVIFALAVGLLLNLLRTQISGAFTDDAEVARIVQIGFGIVPLFYAAAGIMFATLSALTAIGCADKALRVMALYSVVLVPILGFTGGRLYAAAGVLGGVTLAAVGAAAASTHYMIREGLSPASPAARPVNQSLARP